MHLNIDLTIEQILQAINQLPDEEKNKLIERINGTGNTAKPLSTDSLKELTLAGPVWTDEDYLEKKRHIQNSRLS